MTSCNAEIIEERETGLIMDLSEAGLTADFLEKREPMMAAALQAMDALESGSIVNVSEQRMVGHYWLRQPSLAPLPELRREIEEAIEDVRCFAEDVREGKICGAHGAHFSHLLLIGIGGSSLGPMFVAEALGGDGRMDIFSLDNTDPDGMDRVFSQLEGAWEQTLVIVTSKSGSTVETRNGLEETIA